MKSFESSVCVSALTGENVNDLAHEISVLLSEGLVDIDIKIPIARMDLVNLLHSKGKIHTIEYSSEYVHVQATVHAQIASNISKMNSIST